MTANRLRSPPAVLALARALAREIGMRQTISRSPDSRASVIAAMSRWSNSDICSAPHRQRLMAGARNA